MKRKLLYLSSVLIENCSIDLDVSINLDAKKSQSQFPRMFFVHDEGTRVHRSRLELRRGAGEVCREMVTYVVQSNVSNKNFLYQ